MTPLDTGLCHHNGDSLPLLCLVVHCSCSDIHLPQASFDFFALSVVYRTVFIYQYDMDEYLRSILIIPVHSNVRILNEFNQL